MDKEDIRLANINLKNKEEELSNLRKKLKSTKINELTLENIKYLEECKRLKKIIEDYTENYSNSLKTKLAKKNDTIKALKKENQEIKSALNDMNHQNKVLKEKIKDPNRKTLKLKSKIKELESCIADLKVKLYDSILEVDNQRITMEQELKYLSNQCEEYIKTISQVPSSKNVSPADNKKNVVCSIAHQDKILIASTLMQSNSIDAKLTNKNVFNKITHIDSSDIDAGLEPSLNYFNVNLKSKNSNKNKLEETFLERETHSVKKLNLSSTLTNFFCNKLERIEFGSGKSKPSTQSYNHKTKKIMKNANLKIEKLEETNIKIISQSYNLEILKKVNSETQEVKESNIGPTDQIYESKLLEKNNFETEAILVGSFRKIYDHEKTFEVLEHKQKSVLSITQTHIPDIPNKTIINSSEQHNIEPNYEVNGRKRSIDKKFTEKPDIIIYSALTKPQTILQVVEIPKKTLEKTRFLREVRKRFSTKVLTPINPKTINSVSNFSVINDDDSLDSIIISENLLSIYHKNYLPVTKLIKSKKTLKADLTSQNLEIGTKALNKSLGNSYFKKSSRDFRSIKRNPSINY